MIKYLVIFFIGFFVGRFGFQKTASVATTAASSGAHLADKAVEKAGNAYDSGKEDYNKAKKLLK